MSSPLDPWEARLQEHFKALARKRAGSGFPIFALEHGLSSDELDELSNLLLARLKTTGRLNPHWLCWVIYATERGYGYSGDEYWQSFEDHTPNWEGSDRRRIIPWFEDFQRQFDGVEPTGLWASHFRIIAWPITHAILPRYLQHQFAKALYDLRYRLAGISTLDPASIGRLLASHAHTSTRFEEFLQQEELTGRIVLALLGETATGRQEPIYPPTLARIVNDLGAVRNAREWLKEAQRVVGDRFKGIGRGSVIPSGTHQLAERQGISLENPIRPSIRPKLTLRYTGSGTWSVVMVVPDFRAIADNANILTFLKSTRCRVTGVDGARPGGWLLSGVKRAVLKSWPTPKEPLLDFEYSHGTIDHLIQSDCLQTEGPHWLFKIGRDGIASEIAGKIVRPGHDYIIISLDELTSYPWVSTCSVDCKGIKSYRLNVPPQVTGDDIAWLQRLKIQVARTIRVWPSGLPGRNWDGEGTSEWLTTEAPCFGLVADFPIEAYKIKLDNYSTITVEGGRVGIPSFFRIPPLKAGKHFLEIKAQRDSTRINAPTVPEAEGFLFLNVRDPEPWIPGTPSHAGLIATIDPHDADLDTFWENRVKISIIGPDSYRVTCSVTLSRSDGSQVLSEQIGDAMDLPITTEIWHRHFADFVKREHCAWRYLEASSGSLSIKADELGEYILNFERDTLPIRWVLRNVDNKIQVRLIDDTGQEQNGLELLYFSMTRPAFEERLTPEAMMEGKILQPPGGLFVARRTGFPDAVFVSAGLTGTGLQGLGVAPDFRDILSGSIDPVQVCNTLELWNSARLTGFLPDIRRKQIIDGMQSALYGMLCGSTWAKVEETFQHAPRATYSANELQRNVDKNPGFAAVLRKDFVGICENLTLATRRYSEIAARYGICGDSELCYLALRLASEPHTLPSEYGDKLSALIDKIRSKPALIRGARLLVLLSTNHTSENHMRLLPRWQK